MDTNTTQTSSTNIPPHIQAEFDALRAETRAINDDIKEVHDVLDKKFTAFEQKTDKLVEYVDAELAQIDTFEDEIEPELDAAVVKLANAVTEEDDETDDEVEEEAKNV